MATNVQDLSKYMGLSPRQQRLLDLRKCVEGTQYDRLLPWKPDTFPGTGKRIPKAKRAPSTPLGLCGEKVGKVVDRLASERYFPTITVTGGKDAEGNVTPPSPAVEVQELVDSIDWPSSVQLAATDLLNGSGCFGFTDEGGWQAVYRDHVWCDVIVAGRARGRKARAIAAPLAGAGGDLPSDGDGPHLPFLKADGEPFGPDEPVFIRYEYPVEEEIHDEGRSSATVQERTWVRVDYLPTVTVAYEEVTIQAGQTHRVNFEPIKPIKPHNWGRIPLVWMKPAGTRPGDIDGTPLLVPEALALSRQADYASSAADDSNELNAHPQLVLLDVRPVGMNTAIQSGIGVEDAGTVESDAGGVINLRSSGEKASWGLAKPGSDEAEAARDHIERLKQDMARITGVPSHDPERMKGVMSGEAYKRLNEPFIDRVEGYATTLGKALRQVVQSLASAVGAGPVDVSVEWAPMVVATADDRQKASQTWTTAVNGNICDIEDGARGFATDVGIDNVEDFVARAVSGAEQRMRDALEMARATQPPEEDDDPADAA